MKKAGVLQFVSGFMLGALALGGSIALASGVTAQPKTADVIVDGRHVDLEGYVIDGSHYFQLRGLSESLKPGGKDFSVEWDGANSLVLIDTRRGYAQDGPPTSPGTGQEPAMTSDEMKMEVVRLTNIERVKAGLPELAVHQGLMETAQAKAQDFIDNGYFGHKSPIYGPSYEMIRRSVPGAGETGENLTGRAETPQGAINAWLASPPHIETIVRPRYTHIGVGTVESTVGGRWWVAHYAEIP